MEIGPINGIRPIAMIKPTSPSPDLSGVFAVEFRKQAHDDERPCHQRAARGLEGEEPDTPMSNAAQENPANDIAIEQPRSKVSFFA